MNFTTSLATGVGNTFENVVITPAPSLLQRKIAIFGAVAASKISAGSVTALSPVRVFSPEQVGTIAGTGTQAHRLAINAYAKSNGVETWLIPLAEGGSDVAATGSLTVTVSTPKAGTIFLYVNNNLVSASIPSAGSVTSIAAAIAAAITAMTSLPVSATAALGVVTITSKTKGTWGNDISLSFGLAGEKLPEGVTIAVVQPTGGSGAPVIDTTVLETTLGTGDNKNEKWFTALIHGNGKLTSTLDAIADYVGRGDDAEGCYSPINGRFPRSLIGSTDNVLNDEITIADGRKTDRAEGMICAPNTLAHPQEVAALAMGLMEGKNAELATNGYFGEILPGVIPGASRWTDTYTTRDTAVKSGVGTTMVKSGAVVIQNAITFYRPDDIPVSNNGSRSMRNISVLQNISYYVRNIWESAPWKDVIIVKNATDVYDPVAKRKAKDIQAVKNQILAMGNTMVKAGWIYSIDSIVEQLKDQTSVTVLPGGKGFKCYIAVILSGEGGNNDTTTMFDINFGR